MALPVSRPALLTLIFSLVFSISARADNVKIAMIDAFSSTISLTPLNALNSLRTIAERVNQQKLAGGHTLEFVAFDNKLSPQEALVQLKLAIDQGFRYVVQGGSSAVALALIDAINKHNERHPGKEVLLLNFAAADPDLTNAKCSFWHFRFDANADMKMEVLTSHMADYKKIRKVYLINQNYSYGQQVRRAATEYLKRKRPDIDIVGDDLHPLAQVKDFAPYIAKIKASGADTIVTGNWGADLALLIKAAQEADVRGNFYTFFAPSTGVPTAMGAGAAGRVKFVGIWHQNADLRFGKQFVEPFKKKYKDDFYVIATYTIVEMLARAMRETRSTDPVKIAFALEGMKVDSLNGEVEMRREDHQAQQPLYVATWSKVDGKEVKYDQENTGYGWKTDQKFDSYVAAQPTSCQMKRPGDRVGMAR